MPRAFPMGHRRRGAGYTTSQLLDIERASVLAKYESQTWYVAANAVSTTPAGSASNTGQSWSDAFALLQTAISAAVAGDIILVGQGHTENITAAATIAISKALQIVGMGWGRRRPVFTWTTLTTATITIAGSNVWIENCVFAMTGIDALVTGFAVTGDDVSFVGCEFETGNATNQCALGITVTGTDRFSMIDCHVHGTIDAGMTNFVQIVGSAGKQKDYQFIGNTMIAACTTTLGLINNITVALVNCVVQDNTFVNLTASATKVFVALTGSTGLVMNNRCGIGSGAAPFSIDAGWWAGNWSAAAVATNGTLV